MQTAIHHVPQQRRGDRSKLGRDGGLTDLRGNFGKRSVNFRMILRGKFAEILAIDLSRGHATLGCCDHVQES
ncbi:unnamed protein product [Lasius platythorax]|uniref:Uncharacterized protein n=1 Tax=Lasius platythorax TaxID=488582 RepID=A0AAV2NWI6_9HYME